MGCCFGYDSTHIIKYLFHIPEPEHRHPGACVWAEGRQVGGGSRHIQHRPLPHMQGSLHQGLDERYSGSVSKNSGQPLA